MRPIGELMLTDGQHFQALIRFRDAIAAGMELKFFDSNQTGYKDTQATWGQCSKAKEMWPDKETHMWPDDPRDVGSDYIYGIKYHRDHQMCPMDKRKSHDGRGCFYSCRIFQGPVPSREEALKLYDLSIERVKRTL